MAVIMTAANQNPLLVPLIIPISAGITISQLIRMQTMLNLRDFAASSLSRLRGFMRECSHERMWC